MITPDEAKEISALINSVTVYATMAHDSVGKDTDKAKDAMKWHNDAFRTLEQKYGITGTMYKSVANDNADY